MTSDLSIKERPAHSQQAILSHKLSNPSQKISQPSGRKVSKAAKERFIVINNNVILPNPLPSLQPRYLF